MIAGTIGIRYIILSFHSELNKNIIIPADVK